MTPIEQARALVHHWLQTIDVGTVLRGKDPLTLATSITNALTVVQHKARREVWEEAAQELEDCISIAGASGIYRIDAPWFIVWCRAKAAKETP